MPWTGRHISTVQDPVSSTASRFLLTFFMRKLREEKMNRIEILKGFLDENPNDSFSRYALALEYVKLDKHDDAVQEFETVKKNDPDYVATYFQLGQLYQKMGKPH